MRSASVQGIISTGTAGIVVDIECRLSNSLPNIVIVGFASRSVAESKERIRGGFATSRIMLPRKRIIINLAPADIPKADSGFDLAIAVAILQASQQIRLVHSKQQAFIGELGLDGNTRAVRGIIGKILHGRAKGIITFFIPRANLGQARLIPKVVLMPVDNLRQLYEHLNETTLITPIITGTTGLASIADEAPSDSPLSAIIGQAQAKRALEIAAAGGHNVFFSGPPGTGKSMLAKALQSILPPLNREETLEVTHLHSLAGHDYDQTVTQRPFRAPHHSASHTAITGGGGSNLRPGELSLAHRGVLFFDELPEFSRTTLEVLRQPLEDHMISLARAKDSIEYPANFIMVATANPCPCGYYGTGDDACQCKRQTILNYRQKISGPILDRIDLYTDVHEVQHKNLLTQQIDPVADEQTRQRIVQARQRQAARFGDTSKLNTDMSNADIKQHAKLTAEATELLNIAAERVNLSARSYMRAVKVARTIADLENNKQITAAHISEALQYRGQNYKEQS